MTEVLASHVSSPQSDGLDWSEGPRLELDQLLAQLVVRAQNVMAAQGRLRGLLVESVMTATVNWLSAMRMFLDHQETDLTRRFGKLSPEFVAFKTATSAAYDSEVGYRFAYQLRNYVQHCGLPLGHVDVRRSGNPLMKKTATLLLNRQVL